MSEKELFTRRINTELLRRLRSAAKKIGMTHTTFIERAIDEKLQRDGHYKSSALDLPEGNHS